MDTTLLPTILASVSTLAAIICPTISAVITVRSNEKSKRYEIYAPKVYSCVQRLTTAFSAYQDVDNYYGYGNDQRSATEKAAADAYRELSSSAYELMSLIPDAALHRKVSAFLDAMDGLPGVSDKEKQLFHELTLAISRELASHVSKTKPSVKTKSQRNKTK